MDYVNVLGAQYTVVVVNLEGTHSCRVCERRQRSVHHHGVKNASPEDKTPMRVMAELISWRCAHQALASWRGAPRCFARTRPWTP